jgi:hypothetical protein
VIRPLTPLPPLSGGGTRIDGHTQTTFGGDANPVGPEVVLDGSLLSPFPGNHGLLLNSDSNQVLGLTVHSFPEFGILVEGTGNWIAGN